MSRRIKLCQALTCESSDNLAKGCRTLLDRSSCLLAHLPDWLKRVFGSNFSQLSKKGKRKK